MKDNKKNNAHHLAIIMDGNRRYAKEQGLPTLEGHRQGAKKLKEVLEWCKEYSIPEVTLYTFSVQNFNRTKEEVSYLFDLFKHYFDKLIDSKELIENQVRVNILGRLELFTDDVQQRLNRIMEKTKDFSKFTVNFAMAYGSREELVDAMKKIAQKIKNNELTVNNITEELITEHLYQPRDIDLVIRTGGDKRLSNFFLWQNSYAELFFVDEYWPAFSKKTFENILNEYNARDRRFGE